QVEVDGSHATRQPRKVEYPSNSLVSTRWTKKKGSATKTLGRRAETYSWSTMEKGGTGSLELARAGGGLCREAHRAKGLDLMIK
ncbi:jg278, partial [Pararge aegeria aegeria]